MDWVKAPVSLQPATFEIAGRLSQSNSHTFLQVNVHRPQAADHLNGRTENQNLPRWTLLNNLSAGPSLIRRKINQKTI
jgi:hypothetical protein